MRSFHHQHRVTYSQCTLGNHVFYGRYLDILEEARGEFFRALNTPLKQLESENCIFPVVKCQVHYRSPARYDDVLQVELWIETLTPVRIEFAYRIAHASGAMVLTASTLHACTTIDEKIRKQPEALLATLRTYHRDPDKISLSKKA